tara:strand:- start:7080 stop:9419 length:2340 start_codon:yes stop_codon:yes gene_type:complete
MDEENQESGGPGIFGVLGGIGAAALALPKARRKIVKGIGEFFRDDDKKFKTSVDRFASKAEAQKAENISQEVSKDYPDLYKANEAAIKEQQELEDIRKAVLKKPLSFGGKIDDPEHNYTDQLDAVRLPDYNFGSTLYDFVALHPSKKPLTAQQWLSEFKNPQRMANLKYKTPGFENIKAGVSRQELSDANIAEFDDSGKLIGGILKSAEDSNVKVGKKMLLDMAYDTPGARLQVTEYGLPIKTVKKVEAFLDKAEESLAHEAQVGYKKIRNVLAKEAGNILETEQRAKTKKNLDAVLTSQYDPLVDMAARNLAKIKMQFTRNDAMGLAGEKALNVNANIMRQLKDIEFRTGIFDMFKNNFARDNIPKTKAAVETFQQTVPNKAKEDLRAMMGDIARDYEKLKGSSIRSGNTSYGQHDEYRLSGPETYQELIVNLTPRAGSYKGRRPVTTKHYGRDAQATDQLYFVRYGVRSDFYNPDMKGITIDEIQADIAQQVRKNNQKPPNPFNINFQEKLVEERIKEILPRARELSNKGVNMTPKERQELREINNSAATLYRSTRRRRADSQVDNQSTTNFQPLQDSSDYAEHAVKVLIKKAMRDDLDFISVNTVDVQHNFKHPNAGYKGMENFYGMQSGRSTAQKEAILEGKKVPPLPDGELVKAMKNIAKQYNGRVDKRMVAKSDPSKPFKVIRTLSDKTIANVEPGQKPKQFDEHLAAFKSKAEVDAYTRDRQGEGLKIEKIEGSDPKNYYEIPTLVITPEMKTKPFKIYKREGGLVVDLFKW